MPAKKSIRNGSKLLCEMADAIGLASLLGGGTDLGLLAQSMAHFPDLPDRFNAAFSKSGWFFVSFACGVEPAQTALAMYDEEKSQIEIDAYLADNLMDVQAINNWSLKALGGGIAEPEYPVRAGVVERAFRAFNEGDYVVSTPLMLMLIDGYGVRVTGTKSVFSDLQGLEHLFEDDASIGGHWSGLKSVIHHYISDMKGYVEEPLTTPNRNGILHGTRLNYANKVVAAKTLNLLAGIVEWAIDVSGESKDAQKLRERNQRLLQNKLQNLAPSDPDQTLACLQVAFDQKNASDVAVLLDYDPGVTNLRSKIIEWKDILNAYTIKIERISDWEIIGEARDSEQYAKCQIHLTVDSPEDTQHFSKDDEIYVKRTRVLEEAGCGIVWQVGLNLLGKIQIPASATAG